MLSVRNLQAWYGKSQVLRGVNMEVAKGEIVALLGRNGAGRSTTLKAIMGGVTREGGISFDGQEIGHLPPHRVARLGLGYVPEDRSIFPDLTTAQNLVLGEKPGPGGAFALADAYALFPRLQERAAAPAGALSGGEQQMLAICRTLMGSPALLMVDEPTEGLAPVIVQQIGRTIREIKQRGFTVLLVEQNFRFAATVADRHYIMEHGRVIDMIPNASLEANMDKLHDYLGV